MLVFLFFLRINLTINVAHPVFLMHTQSLLSGYAPGPLKQINAAIRLISPLLKLMQLEITNATLLQAITSLTARFDSQDEKLEEMANLMRRNSIMVTEISKAVEFNASEMKECKEKCLETSKSLFRLTTLHKDLASRTYDLERYKRRLNLRINGMKEKPEEDSRSDVISLFAEITPHLVQKLDDIVYTVHRIGKKEPGKSRQMIVQFTMRKYRDEFWKSTKNSSVCRNRGV